jgi:tripartite-type tricarboxylate transporter receptor subunit TctC
VPKGTPRPVIAKLNATVTQALFDPQVRKRLDELGIQVAPFDQQTPEALRELQKAEAARWWPVIKASNIKVD